MQTIVYDLEIIHAIPDPKRGKCQPNVVYCEGWRDFDQMGISVASYAIVGLGSWVFEWDDIKERERFVEQLRMADVIAGFNSVSFDDNLLAANGVRIKTTYDILYELRLAAYGSFSWEDQPKGYVYSLAAIARANGMEKTGRGDLAPIWWQQGERDKVLSYCLMDSLIERDVLTMALAGELVDPNTQRPFEGVRPLGSYQY